MQQPEPEKTWCLHDYLVVNPNKPGKVRRVANAAAQFWRPIFELQFDHRSSFAEQLGRNLLRFRENAVANLSDIEGMFIQIAIRHEDQCALLFL